MAQIKNTKNTKNMDTLSAKLTAWKDENFEVEIFTAERELTGILSAVGADYVSITSTIERSIESTAISQDKQEEKSTHIVVYEIETLLKRSEIKTISRVLRSSYK